MDRRTQRTINPDLVTMKPYDLAEDWLVSHAEDVVKHLFPAARLKVNDYVIGDIEGNPGDSLHITVKGPKTGWWKDFANGEKGSKNLCTLWKAARKIPYKDHQTFFTELESFSGQCFGYVPRGAPLDWPKCHGDWTKDHAAKLVKIRGGGISPQFVTWLHDHNQGVGTQAGRIVFPVLGPGGAVVGLHRYFAEEGKLKFSKGCKVHPLVFGDMTGPITEVHVHESRWDCYTLASVTGWHLQPGIRFICTLGAGNGKLIQGLVPPGAKVYIWPQNDHAGKNGQRPNEGWRRVVAANAGCETLLVEIPDEHEDLNAWANAEIVTELDLDGARKFAQPYTRATSVSVEVSPAPASKLFPPKEERPCYRIYEAPFEGQGKSWEAGVYLHAVEEKTNRSTGEVTIKMVDRWILSVVRVIAITRTDAGKEHGYLLEFVPHGETVLRREVIPQSLLVNRGDEFMMLLRSWGVSALFENREQIRDYLDQQHVKFSAQKPEDFWIAVRVVGWHTPGCFVLPDRIIGDQDGIWFQGSGEAAQYASNGTLEDWKNQVAMYALNNPYLVFAICCGFSGPLLNLLNVMGIGFHYLGDSTSGKTTALLVATSVWGAPKFMLSWRQTANRLEAQAASRSDCLMTIDESHMVDPRTLDACIYLLLGGVAKGRLKRDSTAAETAHWRIAVLSSGERALETHLSAAQIDHKAGQSVRICDIPVEGKYGVFDQLPPDLSAAATADMLRQNAAKTYGTAGPAFVRRLIQEMPNLDLHTELTQIVKSLDTEGLSAQQQRVWHSFALVGLAGELAIGFGIVPWEKGSAAGAAADLFETWRKNQPESSKSKEHAQVLQRVLDFIERHGDTRFTNIKLRVRPGSENGVPDVPAARERAGWWEDTDARRNYLFTSAGLHEAIGDFDWSRALRALDEAGAFVEKGTDGEKAKRRRTPDGGNHKLYCIDPEKLQ
jgi:uncharacterized protein (DUF927 family)